MAKTYSPKRVAVSVAGIPVTGFADGTFISADYTNDAFTIVTGADGESTFVENADQSGTIEITLKESSDSNDVFSALHATDRADLNGIVPIFIKDTNGRDTFLAAEARIMKQATGEKGNDLSDRTWVFGCLKLEMFAGGNN
jgi:hypothetical protein